MLKKSKPRKYKYTITYTYYENFEKMIFYSKKRKVRKSVYSENWRDAEKIAREYLEKKYPERKLLWEKTTVEEVPF